MGGNIGSLADLPIPTPISNLFNKPAADTPEKPKRKKNMEEKRKRNLTTGTFLSSDFLPQSWLDTKLECRRAQQNEWTRRLPFAHSSGDARAEEESLEVHRRERKREEGSESQRDQLVCKKHHIPLNPM